MINFLDIDAPQIANVLHFVEEGVTDFKEERRPDWKPEHVYGSLFLGFAQLTIIMEEDTPIGFMVSRWMVQTHDGQNYLHVWLFYLTKEARGRLGEITKPAIDYMWQKCEPRGAFLEVPTTRGGWEKYLKPEMELEQLTFRKRA